MRKPPHALEIFLQPGELYFGDRDTRVRTLLGSCVAITLWHPARLIGGMCHYLLPGARLNKRTNGRLDGRYADDALLLFMEEIEKTGTHPSEYEAKMFGGGDQFPGAEKHEALSVPDRNIDAGRHLLARHGFHLKNSHLGGTGHRNVILDVWSGHVWMQHVERSS